ncbi:ABC transporter ATP-binding protein [Halomonas sp. BC04]|uniref:ABC transporter ATP-binding protein n=1 Tax=Halomonas sp. BC04 TaxID=1403540 RepID=UPI0003ED77DF|nr:ABC transporter ATP-binding protein [Halomonas sp. BC04]EWG97836.1 glutathione ABC transporter ATP-binding protein [Halomonas sp. BC04]
MKSPLLSVESLHVAFGSNEVVKNLSFSLEAGQTLAIVGESGSGKSVTSLAIMRLVEYQNASITQGHIRFHRPGDATPLDLTQITDRDMRRIRGKEISMIFQEPMTSLNPVYTIGDQIAEVLRLHEHHSRASARQEAIRLLDLVRLADAPSLLKRYPHQLSGGMRQRVMIAMSLACKPKILVADEPTTALDVTIQAQILAIIRDLQKELGMAVIFITHDMGVVAEVADHVVVMREGEKVEEASVEAIFANPREPYTQALLAAVPKLGSMQGRRLPRLDPLVIFDGIQAHTLGESREQDTVQQDAPPIVKIDNLVTRFDIRKGFFGGVTHRVHAVERVSLEIYPGETLALVGESGSGKSTIGRTIQLLQESTSGDIVFSGKPVSEMNRREKMRLRQEVQYIFQDPFASLDPRKSIGFSIAEPIHTHGLLDGRRNIQRRVSELLERVGLKPEHAERYPHEFSGGQRQRICIARALASRPRLIIADEALSALDVSIQAQIIHLMMTLQREEGLAYLFISHDMAVVEKMSHRVAVLHLGQVVEMGPRQRVFDAPQHDYTRKLLAAVPVADPTQRHEHVLLEGEIPSPIRKVGDEPSVNPLIEVHPGHFVSRGTSHTHSARSL